MNKIRQIRMGSGVVFFKQKMFKKYNLVDYKDVNQPAVFNGFYSEGDLKAAINHKSHLTIVWCGGDALTFLPKFYNEIKNLKDVRHIAKSEFISKDLNKYEIEHVVLPITPTSIIKNKQKRGDNIYIYTDKNKTSKYGYNMLEDIKKVIDKKIIVANKDTYNESELGEIYKQCFLGLRLTKHDGLPNTVVELGLMGRMCVYNGNLPNAIPYRNIDDIVGIINEEYKKRHQDNQFIVDSMFNYLNIGDEWLNFK